MRARHVAGAIGVLAILAGAGDAHAVLCKSKKGMLIIRSACKKKETALNKADDVFQPIVFPPGGARVHDSADKDVGPVIGGYYGGVTVLFSVPGGQDTFSASVNKKGFKGFDNAIDEFNAFLYANNGCTGQRYFEYGSSADENSLVISLLVDSTMTKGYFTRASEVIKNNMTGVFSPYTQSSATNDSSLNCNVGDTAVAAVEPCDPNRFCRTNPLPPQCFCHRCCFASPNTPSTLNPVDQVDLGGLGLTAPLKIVR